MTKILTINHIIYFDGICNLCNWAVKFIIAQDKSGRFSFASLQSKYAAEHLLHANGQDIKYDSVIYQVGGNIYTKSTSLKQCVHSHWL